MTATLTTFPPSPLAFGSRVTLRAAFTDEDGNPTDPTPSSIVFKVLSPSGVETDYDAVTHEGIGQWSVQADLSQAGRWPIRVDSDIADAEGHLRVQATGFPNP